MKVSTKGRYALRTMIDLAVNDNSNPIPLKDIAARQNISLKYMEQIIALLIKAKLVKSVRGNSGGYMLARPSMQYTAGDILRAAEGDMTPIDCIKKILPPAAVPILYCPAVLAGTEQSNQRLS